MLFLICAVVGGAMVLAQLLLSVVALGAGHGLHLHHGHGGTTAGHRGGLLRNIHRHRAGGRAGAARGGGRQASKAGAGHKPGAVAATGHWALAWLQGMFNFQGIVSGATVLGLAGLAATSAKLPGYVALAIGLGAAFVMMAGIDAAFGIMANMDTDGTVDVQQAVGKLGTVYLSIPAKGSGQGKISISLQQRLMEFPAVTFKDMPLETGHRVVVVGILESSVMLVVAEEEYEPEAEK